MKPTMTDEQLGKLRNLVEAYKQKRGQYQTLCDVIEALLETLCEPMQGLPIVKTRTKELKSFADKWMRYFISGTVLKSLDDFSDLGAARVVLPLKAEVGELEKQVRRVLSVDAAKSQDTRDRLSEDMFGYVCLHLIVKVKPLLLDPWMVDRSVWVSAGGDEEAWLNSMKPEGAEVILTSSRWEAVQGLTIEIQLRTIAEHAWSEISHTLDYKQGAFKMPAAYKRKLARVAAEIEQIDEVFSALTQDVQRLRSNAGTYLSPKASRVVADRLQAILDSGAGDIQTVVELARVLVSIGEFDRAIDVSGTRFDDHPRGQKWRGRALCLRGKRDNEDHDYGLGRRLLEQAHEADKGDLETLTFLAESYLPRSPELAHELFLMAAELDASDPAVLAGLLRTQLDSAQSERMLSTMTTSLDLAIQRCRDRIAIRENLPDALYQLADFLMLRQPVGDVKQGRSMAYEGLRVLCQALCLTQKDCWRLHQAQAGYEVMSGLEEKRPWLRWARHAVLARRAADGHVNKLEGWGLTPTTAAQQGLYSPDRRVMIVAGGCVASAKAELEKFGPYLETAIASFQGDVISGGTREGVSGIVGEQCKLSDRVNAIGYLPKVFDSLTASASDALYDKLVWTDSTVGFSAAEPIQSWIDLLSCGVDPSQVTLIGLNGGAIASFEYQFAAAMGARVVLITGSGRAVDDVWVSRMEPGIKNKVYFIPADTECIREVIEPAMPTVFDDVQLEQMIDTISDTYEKTQQTISRRRRKEQAKANPELATAFNESNRQQALHILKKVNRLSELTGQRYTLAKADDPRKDETELLYTHIDKLAEMEHARWVVERTFSGWQYGERDNTRKTRPTIISWEQMQEMKSEVEKDYNVIGAIPMILDAQGYKIVREQSV